ncbi:hypothetical protein BGZ51_007537 [Haplosporangium sp. Z 767]|nr:hypothetical protein BGZ51_007537 [Haplosporangium sp. Z 767]
MDSENAGSNNNNNSHGTPGTDASVSSGIPAMLSPVQWFKSRAMNAERLNFPDFVSTLGYWREEDAHDAFMELLSFSELPQRMRSAMRSQYETWRRNDGKEYWASRAISSNISMSAKRIAVGLISKSEHIIKSKLTDECVADSDVKYGFYDEKGSDQHGNTNDAYNDDPGRDNEYNTQNSNAEPSSPTKKRKGSKQFTDDRRKSLQRRYTSLGEKWILRSGTVVEDILFEAGKQMMDFHPIHSFMLDLSDKITRQLFSKEDWIEICSNLPDVPPYPKEASDYLDKFDRVKTLKDLQDLLDRRPQHTESQLIHECLLNWLHLYETDDPSPFNVAGSLPENWWLKSAWGVCTNLAKGVPGCFVLPGEMTGHDSSARRNNDRETTCGNERKRMGVRADLVWRSVVSPETDWAIAEAAKVWCPQGNKYISESKFKLPRQLHDVLIGRTTEVGGANELRNVLVSGLIIGGPCIQRIGLCWGAAGDNVTRIIKIEATRLDARISYLSNSLLAIHELLCFRASTIRLISQYELAAKRHANQRKRDRYRSLAGALLGPRISRLDLLQSSP